MENKLIYLTEEEVETLQDFVKNGTHNAHLIKRARVLLRLNRSGKKDHLRIGRIAEETELSKQSVYNIRNDYLNSKSLEEFLTRKKRETPPVPHKLNGEAEAHIIALACSEPPKGYARWTVRLIAEKAVELHYVDGISHMTIYRLLKKRNISLI